MTIDTHSNRRRFLLSAAGVSLYVAGGHRFAVADAEVVETIFAELKNLKRGDAQTLLCVARTLFPHEFLGDSFYAHAVANMDQAASADAKCELISDGLRQLPDDFTELDVASREAALGKIVDSPFFRFTRRSAVAAIYGNPEVWQRFGYPGPSLPFGGWVNRELVDIDWLPEVTQ